MSGRSDAAFFTDNRAHPRVRIEKHTVYYHTDLAYDGEGTPADTIDLSRCGVSFLAHKALGPGTELRLRLQVPFKQLYVRASGRVVRCEPADDGAYRVAVSYRKLLTESEEALFDTLLELLTR